MIGLVSVTRAGHAAAERLERALKPGARRYHGPAAEALLRPPHADRTSVWALATLACLTSGDYRNAREAAPHLPVT